MQTEDSGYYEELIAEWSKPHEGPDAQTVLLEMLPIGDQLAVALGEASRRIGVLEAAQSSSVEAIVESADGVLWEDEGVMHRASLTAEGNEGVAVLWLARIRAMRGETVYLTPDKRRALAAALLRGI